MSAYALRKYATALSAGTSGADLLRMSIRKSGSDTFATGSDWSPAAGDVKVSKDGGAQANITTLPSYSNGSWEFTLSATELTAKTVRVIVANASIINDDATIETFGNASAMYGTSDYTDGVRQGLTALPNAGAGTNGGLPLSVDASGRVDVLKINGTSQTGRDIGASVLLSNGTGAGQIVLNSGQVTAGTVADKTGYSLSQAFPANFSSFAISAGGAVTVGTNGDKTGYSLSVTPPTAAQIATQLWQDLTSGTDFTTSGSIGKALVAFITEWNAMVTANQFTSSALANAPTGGGGGGLSGPSSVTLTFHDAGGNPVPNVEFTLVGIGSGRANSSGVATFGAQDGTYTVASVASGMLFSNASLTVSGTTAQTISGTAITFQVARPGTTVVYLTTRDASGNPVSGVQVQFGILSLAGYGNAFNAGETVTSDSNGLVQVALPSNAKIYYGAKGGGESQTDIVPTTGPYALKDLIGIFG